MRSIHGPSLALLSVHMAVRSPCAPLGGLTAPPPALLCPDGTPAVLSAPCQAGALLCRQQQSSVLFQGPVTWEDRAVALCQEGHMRWPYTEGPLQRRHSE